MTVGGPTMAEINMLRTILAKAEHPGVADSMLKGFLWAVWPEWYDLYAEAMRRPGSHVEVNP